eukprot:1558998-Amphidinium_carterae.3
MSNACACSCDASSCCFCPSNSSNVPALHRGLSHWTVKRIAPAPLPPVSVDEREGTAAELGLSWPPPKKHKGRPSKETLWKDLLSKLRWQEELAKSDKKPLGRKPILNAAQITVLTDLVGGEGMQAVIAKQLSEWGVPWHQAFRGQGSKAEVVPVAAAVDLQRNLLEKMVWMIDHAGIGPDRIVNIDEIVLQMLPSAGRGWSSSAEKVKHIMKDKDFITRTLALPMMPGKILISLVFKGRTKQSLPSVDLDFINAIDSGMNPGIQHAWLLLMDVATVHTSEETRQRLKGSRTNSPTSQCSMCQAA